jgi:hypothetical protein
LDEGKCRGGDAAEAEAAAGAGRKGCRGAPVRATVRAVDAWASVDALSAAGAVGAPLGVAEARGGDEERLEWVKAGATGRSLRGVLDGHDVVVLEFELCCVDLFAMRFALE